MTKIQAWETDEGDIVVWGTHDPNEAYAAYEAWILENYGDDMKEESRLPRGAFSLHENFGVVIRWGHPFLLQEEDWTERQDWVLKVFKDGFEPFMVVMTW